MKTVKSSKIKNLLFWFISILLFSSPVLYPQSPESEKEKPTQYRRGIELNKNQQSYEEKYTGKNLIEEKKRLFPLGYEDNHLSKVQNGTGIWTELNPNVPRVDYVGIHFINKDTGWASGALGALIKTTDGGKSWTIKETNTTLPVLRVRSYNGQTVIACGYDGLILRSTDGGDTFTQINSGLGSRFDLWGLEIVNDTLGWACGATALLRTTDGGENWQIVNTPGYTGNLWWIDFLDEDYGFIAADGKVLKTINGGKNWEIIQAGNDRPLYTIDIIDSFHIAAAGYGGTDYYAKNIYSSDGGYTWINGGNLTTVDINCIQYVSPDTGYLVMSDAPARKTTNRGQEWTTILGISDNYEIQLLDDNIGYTAGTALKISKAEGNLEIWDRLFLNDNFSDVFFIDEQKGFALSGRSSTIQALYRTVDGGRNWEGVSGAPGGNDILFLDSLTGFIGSDRIYKSTDGGISWYIPNGGQGGAGKIFFINQETGLAIQSYIIYKTTDRGENWITQFTAPLSVSFNKIYFSDSLNGWISGGRPYKTTDGGNNWLQHTNAIIWNSGDVYFLNADTGWFTTSNSINTSLYKTINNGLTWIPIPEVFGASSFYLFPDKSHWIVSGSIYQNYFIYKKYITYDGGDNWTDITEEAPFGMSGFTSVTDKLGFASGGLGLIVRYNDTGYIETSEFTLSKTKINFDSLVVGTTKTDSIQILNTGTTIINITDISITNEHFTFSPEAIILPPKEYTYLMISFTPADTITQQGFLIIISNALSSPDTITVEAGVSRVVGVEVDEIVMNFKLYQNHPNPFNSSTAITYQLPQNSFVNISLYDIKGEKITQLVNEEKDRGLYKTVLDNIGLPSGVYFVRMISSTGYSAIIKITVIK
jgi:photosystem II stability/assembly factor-like uncharacterized protein